MKYDLGNLETHSKDREVEKALKHYQDAVSDCSTAINKQSPDYPIFLEKAYLYRALTKIRLGELKTDKEKAITLYNEAINDLTKAIRTDLSDELNAGLYLHRVEAYLRLGDLKATRGNTEKAQSLYSEILDDFAKAIKLDPDSAHDFKLTPHTAYNYYIQGGLELILGQSKVGQGDVEKARKFYGAATSTFNEAEKLDLDDRDVYYDKAINVLKPDDADTYQMRGVLKTLRGQSKTNGGGVAEARLNYKEAIRDYQEAIKRYGKTVEENSKYIVSTYTNMGYTKRLLGKSLESDPEQENMKYARSLYKEAEADYEKAKELDPNIEK